MFVLIIHIFIYIYIYFVDFYHFSITILSIILYLLLFYCLFFHFWFTLLLLSNSESLIHPAKYFELHSICLKDAIYIWLIDRLVFYKLDIYTWMGLDFSNRSLTRGSLCVLMKFKKSDIDLPRRSKAANSDLPMKVIGDTIKRSRTAAPPSKFRNLNSSPIPYDHHDEGPLSEQLTHRVWKVKGKCQ